jgi:uncharacterized protein (UPF0262 family)
LPARAAATGDLSYRSDTLLDDIRIHGPVWDAAPSERRREWRQLIREMLEQHPRGGGPSHRLVITTGGSEGTVLDLETLDGERASRAVVPSDALAPHFREYFDICHRMAMLEEGSHSARLEALDMGKKLAHDKAGEVLLGICAPIVPDHPTARCLFTLLISLHFDTSRLVGGHRIMPG